MQAQRFHDGFSAQIGAHAKQAFERAVGELDPPGFIQQQQALDHAVEQDLLLGLELEGLLLPRVRGTGVRPGFSPATAQTFAATRNAGPQGGGSGNDQQGCGHAEGSQVSTNR